MNARYRVLDPRKPGVVWLEASTRYWAESKIACLGEPGVEYVIVDLDASVAGQVIARAELVAELIKGERRFMRRRCIRCGPCRGSTNGSTWYVMPAPLGGTEMWSLTP